MSWTGAERPRPPRSSVASLVLALAVGVGVGAVVLWLLGPMLGRHFRGPANDPDAQPRPVAPATPPDNEELEAINLFKDARDSVVNVDTVVRVRRFDMRVQEQQAGTGSGFVWDDDGRIVTNFHVIQQASEDDRFSIRVVLADRTAWDARVVGRAPEFDLAVLQIDAPKDRLKKIAVGASGGLLVGQKVYAIGNPFGLSQTMTKGIISALEREIESPAERTIPGAIQVDAPINPGNSGGPLLDKDGRLIGVNTAIKSPSGGNVGIGFAIPVDTVNEVVPELIRRGRVPRPDAGLRLVDERILRRNGIRGGVMVGEVFPNGPADKAGLQGLRRNPDGTLEAGDLIRSVDGEPVGGNTEFIKIIGRHKPGDVLKIGLERGGRPVEAELTLRGV